MLVFKQLFTIFKVHCSIVLSVVILFGVSNLKTNTPVTIIERVVQLLQRLPLKFCITMVKILADKGASVLGEFNARTVFFVLTFLFYFRSFNDDKLLRLLLLLQNASPYLHRGPSVDFSVWKNHLPR
jgi:hypothetical protein